MQKIKNQTEISKAFLYGDISRKNALRGLLSFFIVLLLMPLGHLFVILLGRNFDGFELFIGAFFIGLLGIICAVCGNKLKSEAMQILAGIFGAILFWGSWVEFIYISYGKSLHVPPLMDGNVVLTKPEYLMMPTSIPFAVLSFLMYTYMAKSHWGFIIILRKWLRIKLTEVPQNTNYAIQSFIDLLLLIWWSYLVLLIEFDPSLLGPRHPVTMITSTVCLIIGLILLIRSMSATNWPSALRQAIVTVCVLWTYIEVMIKLKLFTEIWIYPEKYIVQIILLVVAFIATFLLIFYFGHKDVRRRNN